MTEPRTKRPQNQGTLDKTEGVPMKHSKSETPVPGPCPEPVRGMRIAEAARYTGLTPWLIELKIRSGELPALKLTRHYVLLREDLDAFLDRERSKVTA